MDISKILLIGSFIGLLLTLFVVIVVMFWYDTGEPSIVKTASLYIICALTVLIVFVGIFLIFKLLISLYESPVISMSPTGISLSSTSPPGTLLIPTGVSPEASSTLRIPTGISLRSNSSSGTSLSSTSVPPGASTRPKIPTSSSGTLLIPTDVPPGASTQPGIPTSSTGASSGSSTTVWCDPQHKIISNRIPRSLTRLTDTEIYNSENTSTFNSSTATTTRSRTPTTIGLSSTPGTITLSKSVPPPFQS